MRFVVALVGLVVSLLVGSVSLAVAADGPLGSSLPVGSVEDTQARTAFSETYELSDGSKATVVSADQVHFRDTAGNWRPIDNELTRASDGAIANGPGPLDVRIPADISQSVSVARDGRSVSMRLLDADATVRLDGETASFVGALSGVRVDYAVHGPELKETLTVHGDDVPSVFRFVVDLSVGLSLREDRDGGAEVVDQNGDVVFTLPPAVMWASGQGPADARPVAMSVEHADDKTLLVLRPDADWLREHAAQDGVVIDPTITLGSQWGICTIDSAHQGWSPATRCTYGMFGWGGTRVENRALIAFNTSMLSGMRIASATLKADSFGYVAGNYVARKVSKDWNICVNWASATMVGDLDLDCQIDTSLWSTLGGDFTTRGGSAVNVASGDVDAITADMTVMVQDWLDQPSSNHGVLLRASDQSGAVSFSVGNDESYVAPRLVIVYSPELGRADGHEVREQALTDRLSLVHDVGTGNVLLEGRDVNVQSRGMPFSLTRSYNSLSGRIGMFGRGMTSNLGLDQRITQVEAGLPARDAVVSLVDGSGRELFFRPEALDGRGATPYTALTPDCSARLTHLASGTWTLVERDGTERAFDSGGYLTTVSDKDDNAITITYSASPKRPSTMADTQGRSYALAYNADGLISSVTDGTSRVWRYDYATDGSKRMLTSTDPASGATTYGWTSSTGRINRIVTPAGRITKLTHNADGRIASILRVTNRTTEAGDTVSVGYLDQSCLGCSGGTTVTVTDERGHAWNYNVGFDGRATSITSPAGPGESRVYNAAGQLVSKTVGGARWITGYDAADPFHPTGTTDPVGVRSSQTYDPSHPDQIASTLDELGTTIRYSYSDASGTPAAGRLTTASVTGLGAVYQYSYNGYGQLLHVTTGAGNAYVDYGYNNAGELTSITRPNPRGNQVMSYDALSRLQIDTDASLRSRTIGYDRLDRPTSITYSDGSSIAYEYDGDGNQTRRTVTPARGTAEVTSWTYDTKGRLTDQTLPSSARTHYDYDATDNLTGLTDASGTVSYGYDNANRLTSVTEPPVGRTAQVTTIGYDSYGNRSTITTPNSRTVTYSYNAAGRQSAMTLAPSGGGTALVSRSYDYVNPDPNAPQRTTTKVFGETNEDGDTTSYAYSDPLARLTAATVRNRGGTQLAAYGYAYDAQGNLTRRTKDGVTTYYAVDGASLLNGTGLVQGSPSTTYTWDRAGFLTAGTDGLALVYNAKSQTTSLKKDTATAATAVAYADADQTQPTTEGADTLTNDTFGIATRTTAGATTAYTRTPDGQLIGERTPSARYFFATDRQGSILGLTDGSGTLARKLRYDPYGQTTVNTGTAPTAYGYAGGETTANGFVRYGKRYYAPALGRWTQPDSLEQADDLRQANPFAYAGDDPTNATDPAGTCLIPDPLGNVRKGSGGLLRFTETGHRPVGSICGVLGPKGFDQKDTVDTKKVVCRGAGLLMMIVTPESSLLKIAFRVAGGISWVKC